jgi:enoyl-[acyl-carrier-protein] reductase (NADH)
MQTKNALVIGIANKSSISAGIAQQEIKKDDMEPQLSLRSFKP